MHKEPPDTLNKKIWSPVSFGHTVKHNFSTFQVFRHFNYEGCSKSKFPYFVSPKGLQLEQICKNVFIGNVFSFLTSHSFLNLDQRLPRY